MSFRGKRLGNSAGDFAVNDALSNYSIPYKTAGGKVLWLPPGTAGQALKTVGSSIGWDEDIEGSDGGGSGGGGGGDFFGATGPRTAPPQTGWSWFNQRSSTEAFSSRDGSAHLHVPLGNAGASTVATGRMRTPALSTPYTLIVQMEGIIYAADYVNYGLCFGNAGSEIRMLYFGYVGGALNVYIAPTSGGTAGGATYGPFTLRHHPTFWALRDDGTNKKYYLGVQEEHMYEIYSEARTTQFTPTQIGYFACPRQNSFPVDLTLWSWKEQSAAPTTT